MLAVVVYMAFVLLPVFLWLKFLRWQDRAEPEPKRLLVKTFLLGMLSAVLLAIAELVLFGGPGKQLDPNNLLSHSLTAAGMVMLALAGPVEELGKFLVLKEYVYDKDDFNQIAD